MPSVKYKIQLSFAKGRVGSCMSKMVKTNKGFIEFIDEGEGAPVLLSHGIVGGCDQGMAIAQSYMGDGYRFISVSRFGYMRSPLPADATPAAQADLYAALLDELGIDKIIIIGFSAGSPSAMQFAIRHPKRCAGLILASPVMEGSKLPIAPARFMLKKFFGSDFIFWFMMNYMRSTMLRIIGVPYLVECRLTAPQSLWLSSLMRNFLPVSYRVKGTMNDIRVTIPDLNDNYLVQAITSPALIIHAVDDSLTKFNKCMLMSWKMPNAEFMQINSGGHLLMGYHQKVKERIGKFIARNYAAARKVALTQVS